MTETYIPYRNPVSAAAQLKYSDAQRDFYLAEYETRCRIYDAVVDTFGQWSDEEREAGRELNRAHAHLGIVEGWRH